MRVVVVVIFILLICLFTFPLVFQATNSIYGWEDFPDDPLGTLWWIWWYANAWSEGIDSGFVSSLAYPFGLNWAARPIAPLLDYPVGFINLCLGNEVLTYNLVLLIGIFLSGLCMYYCVSTVTRCRSSGIVAAVIFTFSPNQLMHCGQHLGLAVSFGIPLYFLFLYRLSSNLNIKNVIICAIAFAFVTLSNYYYGFFAGLLTVIWFLFMLIVKKREFITRRNLGIFFLGLICCCFIIFPFILPKLVKHGSTSFYTRDYRDLFRYAARWWDYFVPSEFHPLFGKLIVKRHYFERTLYLGYLPLGLAIIAVIEWWRKEKKAIIVPFLGISAVLFFFFSLQPMFHVYKLKIPNLGYFAYQVLPMFRVYARMGIVVLAAVAVLAGFGVRSLLKKITGQKYIFLLTVICVLVVLFEYINVPPFHNIDLSKTPAVYCWLAAEPEETVVVEYPFVRSADAQNSEYLFYQTRHKKILINGAADGSLAEAFRRACQKPCRLDTAKLLKYLGADYLILHQDKYTKDQLIIINSNPGLEKCGQFVQLDEVASNVSPGNKSEQIANDCVYLITAAADNLVVVFWEKCAQWEEWTDGRLWRWLGNNATIWIGNGPINGSELEIQNVESKKIDISFRVAAFIEERELELYLNNNLIAMLNVLPTKNPRQAQEVVLGDVTLLPGGNVLKFTCLQGDDVIGDVLGTEDRRRVSFAVSDFEVK